MSLILFCIWIAVNLPHFVSFPDTENSSFKKRSALVHYVAISDEDSKTVEFIVTQLQKNLHSSSVEKVWNK